MNKDSIIPLPEFSINYQDYKDKKQVSKVDPSVNEILDETVLNKSSENLINSSEYDYYINNQSNLHNQKEDLQIQEKLVIEDYLMTKRSREGKPLVKNYNKNNYSEYATIVHNQLQDFNESFNVDICAIISLIPGLLKNKEIYLSKSENNLELLNDAVEVLKTKKDFQMSKPPTIKQLLDFVKKNYGGLPYIQMLSKVGYINLMGNTPFHIILYMNHVEADVGQPIYFSVMPQEAINDILFYYKLNNLTTYYVKHFDLKDVYKENGYKFYKEGPIMYVKKKHKITTDQQSLDNNIINLVDLLKKFVEDQTNKELKLQNEMNYKNGVDWVIEESPNQQA
jgi:hypothetical protein